jgi:glucose/mannose-6-phosphate isomerase
LSTVPDGVLDDPGALEARDPGAMLRAVASAGAQVRAAARAFDEAGGVVAQVLDDGRPRSLVVAGMGGSGVSGDVVAAVLGAGCPVPVVTARDYVLPGWVGAMDLVVAVSCSGGTEETLELVDEALRRGARVVGVGAARSALARRAESANAPFLPVDAEGRQPRASLWSLATPVLMLADALGLGDVPRDVVERTADRLDADAERFGPVAASDDNPAKLLALELDGTVPMVWGTGPVGAVAAYRTACQLNENAKYPAVHGVLPEANHNQVVALDGPFGVGPDADDTDDFFRDRVADAAGRTRLRLVLLRDAGEHPQVTRRADVSARLATERGVAVSEVRAEDGHALERLARLVAVTDFASVSLGVLAGVDPTPVDAITALTQQIAR